MLARKDWQNLLMGQLQHSQTDQLLVFSLIFWLPKMILLFHLTPLHVKWTSQVLLLVFIHFLYNIASLVYYPQCGFQFSFWNFNLLINLPHFTTFHFYFIVCLLFIIQYVIFLSFIGFHLFIMDMYPLMPLNLFKHLLSTYSASLVSRFLFLLIFSILFLFYVTSLDFMGSILLFL